MNKKRKTLHKSESKRSAPAPEPNPPRGERKDFVKITVTLAPEQYKLLMDEAARRKMTKEPNPVLSAIVREAVQAYFKGTTLTETA